ncbi:MAG: sigma-54-dependent Fis family transcriptional regulator [candidate division Zixibacteria bacterium]|nr:sigma-54-dependent Fis family transcriptional regulator [candidate division Zixibacteria bacterium]
MEKEKVKVLVIDDDPKVSWILSEGLGDTYDILSAKDGLEGLQMVSKSRPNLVLLDIKMPGMEGLEVLDKIKSMERPTEVIMLSGHGETKNVVESIKRGASEFINKPFDVKEVEIHIQNVLEKDRLKQELEHLRSELKAKSQYEKLIGDSPGMLQIKAVIEQVADSELTVLIRGESGTGKEIVARMLHSLSSRKSGPFVKVNCAAIPRELLEAELFGYEKGAFTGAHKTKPGRFEMANKGTIFLDEIGDMPQELQSKLLQVLEQYEFMRVGGIKNIKIDTRIVCATNRDLEKALKDGTIREDLFYRLNEVTLNLPPLRERKEDIPLLIEHFLQKYYTFYNKKYRPISSSILELLQNFDWPGNVRQLENIIKQIVVREDENVALDIIKHHSSELFSPSVSADSTSDVKNFSLKKRVGTAVAAEEKALITQALNKTNWNRRKAAQLLEISYRSLLYKIKEYQIGQ